MELRVQLKICEGCGCLWFRAQGQRTVYCKSCETKLKDFPPPQIHRRPGRRGRKPLLKVWEAAAGGTQ